MLEGLDAIDWDVYRGAYSSGNEIAQNIRALLSEDINLRRKAQSQLRENISHQGSIYPATIAVIPFIIELLDSQCSPDPYYLLELLDMLAGNAKENLLVDDILAYGADAAPLLVYQPILKAYPTFRYYLKHESAKIRRISLKLLALNKTQERNLRIILRKALRQEKSALMKAAIILEFSNFHNGLGDTEREATLYNAYRKILMDYLRPENERLTRLAAAIALKQWVSGENTVKKQLLDIFFDALKLPINVEDFADFSVDADELIEITKPYFIIPRIGKFDLQSVLPRLDDRALSPLFVHYIGRELVDKVFYRITRHPRRLESSPFWKWQQFDGWIENKTRSSAPLLASHSVQRLEYVSTGGKSLNKDQRKVLEALINCDVFWQIPSNLFSFFYGLPDEREELRKLL
jgi:hypothetical protein